MRRSISMALPVCALALGLLCGPALAAPSPAASLAAVRTVRVTVEEGIVAALSDDGIFLEATPKRGEALAVFAKRLCGDSRLAPQVMEANGGQKELQAGTRYRFPMEILANDWQVRLLRALFPEDKGEADGWLHHVRGVGPLQKESLWQLSLWFTGTGENFRAIREYNEVKDDDVVRGTEVTIPSELLRPAFRAVLPVAEKPFHLDYGKDKDGEYAIYRLRPHEAL